MARLAGPLVYRRILAHAPIEEEFMARIVGGFLREVATVTR